jgi:hypothetical protein
MEDKDKMQQIKELHEKRIAEPLPKQLQDALDALPEMTPKDIVYMTMKIGKFFTDLMGKMDDNLKQGTAVIVLTGVKLAEHGDSYGAACGATANGDGEIMAHAVEMFLKENPIVPLHMRLEQLKQGKDKTESQVVHRSGREMDAKAFMALLGILAGREEQKKQEQEPDFSDS